MANYTKTTDFAAKDTLPGGDTNKVVRGSEFETEFDAISTAIATKADTASPTFTGTVTIPTADINGGNIDGTVIGASTAAAGTFTNITATGTISFAGATFSDIGTVTTADINGGTIDGVTIGGSSAGAGTFSSLTATTADINGGTADNVTIGGSTPAAGTFSSLTATTADINGGTIDGVSIGSSSTGSGAFSSLTVGGSSVLTSVAFSDLDAGAVTTSSETFSDVDNQIPTNAAVIDYVAATIPQIAEINDLTASVTWANVPDANITQSSVTQHEAALSVTASQLSDVTSTAAELNLVDGSTADTVVNSKAVIYGSAGQITANELDVDNIQIDANAIKSTDTNGNIQLFPNGTGFTELYGNTNAGAIRFNCEVNTHGVTLKGPPHSAGATYSLELPDADGTDGQVLQTNGSGKLSFGDTAGGAVLEATASGALANGDTVIVNSDGTVSVVAETAGSPANGSTIVINQATSRYHQVAYNSDNNTVIIVYRDDGNSNYGTAVVGNVSGTSITFGAEYVFESSTISIDGYECLVFDSNVNRAVIIYRTTSNQRTYAKVLTPSSTAITSSSTAVNLISGIAGKVSTAFDSSQNRIVISCNDSTNSYYGTCFVGTVSASSVTFSAPYVFNSKNTANTALIFDSNANKHVIVYRNTYPDEYGRAKVGTVTSTPTITFGSETQLPTTFEADWFQGAFDSSNNKVVVVWYDSASGSREITAAVGTISGTSISFGSATAFDTAASTQSAPISVVFDSVNNKIIATWQRLSNGGTYWGVGTVSGTSISFGTPIQRLSSNNQNPAMAFDVSAEAAVVAFMDIGNNFYGTAQVLQAVPKTTNLTSENYIGISDGAYADGATATIQIVGSVDDAQSGLTAGQQYFIQGDGSLGLTAATPSVVAGTAVSATKIIVKG